jgi:ribose 1,5-bisphosphokinase
VLIVGPSGAGKDAVMRGAQARLADEPSVRFIRRMVTRPVSSAEDHDTCTVETFERLRAEGAFVLSWGAHGLHYGIPASIADAIAAGDVVVMNGSRTVIAEAREKLPGTLVVEITAPAAILAARIAARGRGTDGATTQRLDRTATIGPIPACDHVIDNSGRLDDAIDRLVAILREAASPGRQTRETRAGSERVGQSGNIWAS